MFRILFPHNLSYSTNLCLKSLPNTVVRIYQSKLYTKIQPNSPVNPPTLCDVNFGDIKEREALPPFLHFCKALPSYFIVIMPCRAVQPPPHFFGIFEGVARVSVWWAPGAGAYNYTTKGGRFRTFVTPNKMATQPFPPNFHMEGFTPISALLFGLLYSRFSCAQLSAFASAFVCFGRVCFKYLFEMGDRCSPCSVPDVFFMSRRCFIAFKLRSLHSLRVFGLLLRLTQSICNLSCITHTLLSRPGPHMLIIFITHPKHTPH